MANTIRQHILLELAAQPFDVSSLADRLQIDIPQLSHNLKRLLTKQLVEVKPSARRRIYRTTSLVRTHTRGGKTVLQLETGDGSRLEITLPSRNPMPGKRLRPSRRQRSR